MRFCLSAFYTLYAGWKMFLKRTKTQAQSLSTASCQIVINLTFTAESSVFTVKQLTGTCRNFQERKKHCVSV